MGGHPLVLMDRDRARQFSLLGRTRRLFDARRSVQWTDGASVPWAGVPIAGVGFAVSALGPGWAFDPHVREQRGDLLDQRRRVVEEGREAVNRALREAVGALRLGSRCERVLWSLHGFLLRARRSVFRIPDVALAGDVYGLQEGNWPAHWRIELLAFLKGLTWLHVAAWEQDQPPAFGTPTSLLSLAVDLRGKPSDACDDDCPLRQRKKHHHYQVNFGRGFLGQLEALAGPDDGTGVRLYDFGRTTSEGGAALRQIGQTGLLVQVFLPAKLGRPDVCASLPPGQHDILQALVREVTRRRRPKKSGAPGRAIPDAAEGNLVPAVGGKRRLACPLLDPHGRYVGFNGNGVRRGEGYRLATPAGWMARAGYTTTDIARYVEDLADLTTRLGLVVAGLDPAGDSPWADIDRLRALAGSDAGRHVLQRLHVRVYATEGWEDRWTTYFAGAAAADDAETTMQDAVLAQELKRLPVSRRQAAKEVGVDASLWSKLLNGKKPWPTALRGRARALLARFRPATDGAAPTLAAAVQVLAAARTPAMAGAPTCPLEAALLYLDYGWSVVPIIPANKKPYIKWRPFRTRRPTPDEVRQWFGRWPDADVAVVLGPVSGLFVIDVDGPDAHHALVDHLGAAPDAPKVVSGGGPDHYHLYFRHPDRTTGAKATPWHRKLEFRGEGGLVVAPPSRHKSGNRYAWVHDIGLGQLHLPEPPAAVLAALVERPLKGGAAVAAAPAERVPVLPGVQIGPRTRDFLEGLWADKPGWNDRLFQAACDLKGSGVPIEAAEPALLAGARPWSPEDAEKACRTIASAYSMPREPSLH